MSWASIDDAALGAAVAGSDEAAFAEVYRRHGRSLYSAAVRILNAPQLAEDVVHDVLARLWEHPAGFDANRGTLGAYLRVQLHSRCVDVIRAETSRAAREALPDPRSDPALAPDTVMEHQETLVELHRALVILRHEERAAIELAYFAGLKHVEVAHVLDLPLGTVKARIRRGLGRLRTSPLRLARSG